MTVPLHMGFSPHLLYPCALLLAALIPVQATSKTGTCSECDKVSFVPGYNLVGEGFDVVKLQRKSAYVIDVQTYLFENDTCALRENQLLNGEVQKLPVSVQDWRSVNKCSKKLKNTVHSSVSSLVQSTTTQITNDWKVGLDLEYLGLSVGGELAGTRSDSAGFAIQRAKEDKFVFSSHLFNCVHYRFRVKTSPPLSTDFKEVISALPKTYDTDTKNQYRRFIDTFGTHYIKQVDLGGKIRKVMAIRTCLASLYSLTTQEVQRCLSAGLSVGLGIVSPSASLGSCESVVQNSGTATHDQSSFLSFFTEVTGGEGWPGNVSMTHDDSAGFNNWLDSLKTHPDIVQFSLSPLHLLVTDPDVRYNLKTAIQQYVQENEMPSSSNSHSCGLQSLNLSPDCCPKERSKGQLTVFIESGWDLKGDYWGESEAYVKVMHGLTEKTTRQIRSNYPSWGRTFDFGPVDVGQILRVELWDDDFYSDELLAVCSFRTTSGDHTEICRGNRGSLRFSYSLQCDKHLTGDNCQEYKADPN
ncbi:perforin-1-like [Chanos chanos]|uniref:Perforin-1-like n=1 Tax=Chanos chanos TaxID=29144 RepID=A0A6J2VTC1_CHACN|nr:perforin-1-like [Chanos chanos]